VARRAAHVLTALDAAGTVYVPERLHAVRIAMKKLRYTAELLAEGAGDASAAAAIRVLRRGQDRLGRMHDLDVLLERVRQVQASLTPPNLPVWRDLDALVVSIEDECRRVHARYMRMREVITAQATEWSGTDKGRASRSAETRRMKAS
jgi:CHAD domain-containing protein